MAIERRNDTRSWWRVICLIAFVGMALGASVVVRAAAAADVPDYKLAYPKQNGASSFLKAPRMEMNSGVDDVLPGFVRHGDTGKKEIALTFDDGPKPESTQQFLAVLRQYNVKATFFLVGIRAQQHPELVRAIAADGHTIANHTFHHPILANSSMQEITEEIITCGNMLQSITGKCLPELSMLKDRIGLKQGLHGKKCIIKIRYFGKHRQRTIWLYRMKMLK